MKKLLIRLGATALALLMLASSPAGAGISRALAEGAQPSATALLDAASALIDADFAGSRVSIGFMLDSALGLCDPRSAGHALLQSAREALDRTGADAASVRALVAAARAVLSLDAPAATPAPAGPAATDPVPAAADPGADAAAPTPPVSATLPPRQVSLPSYATTDYQTVVLAGKVSFQVPVGWGGNASGRAIASYSPVNKSGAISPKAGTLTAAFLPREQGADEAVFDAYEEGLAMMSVNSDVCSAREQVTGLPARRIRYRMSIGANRFDCEVVCFDDEEYLYTVGLVQGSKSEYDYFALFDQVVRSLQLGAAEPAPAATAEPVPVPDTPPQAGTGSFHPGEDMAGFAYLLDGRRLTFPTAVRDFGLSGFPASTAAEIACDLTTADHLGGTQYYYYADAMSREMIGVTNLTGRAATVADSQITALVDTPGGDVHVELPGGVCVGAPESAVWHGFPEFAATPIDGNGRFRGSDILYAAGETERGDGSHGYVIIRNDAPLYSALSVICRDGKVVEIKFECLGQLQGMAIFS